MSFKVYIVSIRCLMGLALYNLLDNRDLNLPAAGGCSDACVEIKIEFPFNASWACPEVVYLAFSGDSVTFCAGNGY